MKTLELTNKQARRFILAHQGLLPPCAFEGKEGILSFICRVGCIQFDPLDIVGHNSELVLQSRINNFRPELLESLLYTDRKLVDAWDKMMAIYTVEDWPNLRFRQRQVVDRSRWGRADHVKEVMPLVRQAIDERGPLSSIDLDHDRKVDWPWGPTRLAKVALENMFYLGELVIHHRVHTRKVYDLASRNIPAEIVDAPDPHQTQEEYHDWHILRRVGGVGLLWNRGGMAWHGIYGARRNERQAALDRLVKRGEAIEVKVDGIRYPLYMRNRDLPAHENNNESDTEMENAAIIAPLDNLLWDRELIEALFGFKYRWEVYKPVVEREYGYYVLPVLYNDSFVARFEPGRDKKPGALVIKNWWWERDIDRTEDMYQGLKNCFLRFMDYLGVRKISVKKSLVTREGLDWLPE